MLGGTVVDVATSWARVAPTKASPPKRVQMTRYAATKIHVATNRWPRARLVIWMLWKVRIIGAAVGNIMATIMTIQMARNSGAVSPIVGLAIAIPIPAACQTSTIHAAAARAPR